MMKINPDFIAPCGLYCGVCAIYIAHRDNNQKFKQSLVRLYKGGVTGKGTLPNSENLSTKDINAMAAYLMICLCIASSVRLEPAQERKVTPDVINATNFPVSILKIFPWLSAKRLFYGLFRIGERSVLKNGLKMKKPAIFALNTAIRFSGAL